MNQNTGKSLFFALTSGLLLGIPWVIPSFFPLIFMAWVPLLQLEMEVHDNRNRYTLFNYAFAGFLLWNILGSGLALVQPGKCSGYGAEADPMG